MYVHVYVCVYICVYKCAGAHFVGKVDTVIHTTMQTEYKPSYNIALLLTSAFSPTSTPVSAPKQQAFKVENEKSDGAGSYSTCSPHSGGWVKRNEEKKGSEKKKKYTPDPEIPGINLVYTTGGEKKRREWERKERRQRREWGKGGEGFGLF
jgi:hypothetical protein